MKLSLEAGWKPDDHRELRSQDLLLNLFRRYSRVSRTMNPTCSQHAEKNNSKIIMIKEGTTSRWQKTFPM